MYVPIKLLGSSTPTILYLKNSLSRLFMRMEIDSKWTNMFYIHFLGEKPFECEYCNRKFARASDLKVHLPVHSEDKPFKCDSCDKMFTRYSTLKEHSRTHTGKSQYCLLNICRRSIVSKLFNCNFTIHVWVAFFEANQKFFLPFWFNEVMDRLKWHSCSNLWSLCSHANNVNWIKI